MILRAVPDIAAVEQVVNGTRFGNHGVFSTPDFTFIQDDAGQVGSPGATFFRVTDPVAQANFNYSFVLFKMMICFDIPVVVEERQIIWALNSQFPAAVGGVLKVLPSGSRATWTPPQYFIFSGAHVIAAQPAGMRLQTMGRIWDDFILHNNIV